MMTKKQVFDSLEKQLEHIPVAFSKDPSPLDLIKLVRTEADNMVNRKLAIESPIFTIDVHGELAPQVSFMYGTLWVMVVEAVSKIGFKTVVANDKSDLFGKWSMITENGGVRFKCALDLKGQL